jgi:LysM repeat protein
MLLCLDPEDADALLLMARVHAAQGRAQDALARLDAAVAAGVVAPHGFRDHLENQIQAERLREEEHRHRVMAREQGEIKGLRAETRQLRADNVRLEADVQETLKRERTWKLATIGIAMFSTAVVLAMMILPDADAGLPVAQSLSASPAALSAEAADPAEKPLAEKPPAEAEAVSEPIKTTEAVKVEPAAKPVKTTEPVKTAEPIKTPAQAQASKPPEPVKPPAVEVAPGSPRIHVVKDGDTLERIAQSYYGRRSAWPKIQEANADILKGSTALRIGMKLKIP